MESRSLKLSAVLSATWSLCLMHNNTVLIFTFFRILFPFLSNEDKNLSCYGYSKADESIDSGDPDDYVSIDSGKAKMYTCTWPKQAKSIYSR